MCGVMGVIRGVCGVMGVIRECVVLTDYALNCTHMYKTN